ncbi:MAG: T9SS type A sorting domain-containing protein [Candidatus Zixiibacteriota bacterium]
MKTKLILLILSLAFFASIAYAEDDILNMEIIDTWYSPESYATIGEPYTAIACKDSIIYFANGERVYILESSNGYISLIDSLNKDHVKYVQVFDTLLFVCEYNYSTFDLNTFIYDISIPAEPESLVTLEDIATGKAFNVADTLMILGQFYSIADLDSIYVLGHPRIRTEYFDFDSMRGFGVVGVGEYPYVAPIINIEKLVSYDSVYTLLDTQFIDIDYALPKGLVVRDTLVFIRTTFPTYYGIAVCSINRSATRIEHHNNFETYGLVNKMLVVNDSLLYIENWRSFTICKITSTPALEIIAKYHHGDNSHDYLDFCVDGEYIYAIEGAGDSVAVRSFRVDLDSLLQCSYLNLPEQFEFKTYPNPFNSHCNISYSLNQDYLIGNETLKIHDIKGNLIDEFDIHDRAGTIIWDAGDLPSGVYLIRLSGGDENYVERVVYMK